MTASLVVDIDTSKAKASLLALRADMANQPHTLLLNVNTAALNEEITGFIDRKKFRVTLGAENLKKIADEIQERVSTAVHNAFAKSRDISWGAEKFKADLNSRLDGALGNKTRALQYDRAKLITSVYDDVSKTLAAAHHVGIHSEALTAQVRLAVAAGMTGGNVHVGGVAGATSSAHDPAATAQLARVIASTLNPAVDELLRAATAIAGAAKATRVTRESGSATASTSQSTKNLDGTTTKYSIPAPIDQVAAKMDQVKLGATATQAEANELKNLAGARQSDMLRRKAEEREIADLIKATQAGQAANETGARGAQMARRRAEEREMADLMKATQAGQALNESGTRQTQVLRRKAEEKELGDLIKNTQAGQTLNEAGDRQRQMTRRKSEEREIADLMKATQSGQALNEEGTRRTQMARRRAEEREMADLIKATQAGQTLNESGGRAEQFRQVRSQRALRAREEADQVAAELKRGNQAAKNEEDSAFGSYRQQLANRDKARTDELNKVRQHFQSLKLAASDQYTEKGSNYVAARGTAVAFPTLAQAALGPGKAHYFDESVEVEKMRKAIAGTTPAIDGSREAHKRLTAAMNDGHAAARGLAGSMGALWATYGSVVPLLAFAALGAGLRAIYEDGKKVEYQLAFIKGLGGASLTQKEVEQATAGSMASPTQALEGLRALTQSGLSTKEALAALPDVLSLATVGETSVGDAAYAATGVLKAFGLGISEVGRVSDVMAKSAAVSNASVQDMMAAFKYASASSSMYGASLEETGAALAMLAEKNIKGSMAGTAHMNLLKEIYTPTKKAAEAFKSVGLDMQEMQRQGMSSVEMIDKIRQATSKLDSTSLRAFAAAIGGERGQRELAPLLAGGTKSLVEMQRKLEESKGFTQSVMMELQNTVEGSSARMKQAITFAFSGAFEDSKGPIQAFNNSLANAFGSPVFKSYVDGMARGMVSVTRFLLDHAEAITNVTLAYVALKGASVIVTLMSEVAQAMARVAVAAEAKIAVTRASTLASEVDTLATRGRTQAEHAHNVALEQAIALELGKRGAVVGGAVATAEAAAITSASAVAQTGAMAGVAAATTVAGRAATGLALGASALARGLSFLAGPVGIVIGLVLTLGTLWEVLTAKQGGARDAQDRYTNSVNNTNRVLDQEIERLRLKKYLLDHPGLSEAQGSVKLQIDRQGDYIGQIEAAYKKDVASGNATRLYGKGQSFQRPKYEITNPDGQPMTVNSGEDIKALYESLGKTTGSKKNNDLKLSARDELANLISQSGKVAADSAVIDQKNAQNEFKAWVDVQADELEGRKAGYKNDVAKTAEIDRAIKMLKDRKSPDYLAGIKDSRQAQGIERNLKDQVIDPTGTKWVMPEKPKHDGAPHRELMAESRQLIASLTSEEKEIAQYIKFRKHLDEAKYNPRLYGEQAAAAIAENRMVEEGTDLLKLQQEQVEKLRKLRDQPGAWTKEKKNNYAHSDAERTDIQTEINKRNERFEADKRDLFQQKELASIKAESKNLERDSDVRKQSKRLGFESDEEIRKIKDAYAFKVESPADAKGAEASQAVNAKYAAAALAHQEKIDTLLDSEARLMKEKSLVMNNIDEFDSRRLATLELGLQATADDLVIERDILSVLLAQGRAKAKQAGQVGKSEFEKSQTAEYGWNKFWEQYRNNAESSAKQVEDIMKSTTGHMTDAFSQFVTTGKFNFKSFAASVAADAAKMMANKAISQLLGLAISTIGGMFGGSATVGGSFGGTGIGGAGVSTPQAGFAKGGIMTSAGEIPLRYYAKGGIEHGPAVSVHGEGSLPEANIPLQDGRTVPVTLKGSTGGGGDTNVSMSIHIDSNGQSKVESDASGKKAEQMGKMLEASTMGIIAREKRPGGLLYASA